MNKMKWIIFAVVVIAAFGGIIWFSKSNDKTYTGDASKIITEGPIPDNVYGSQEQKVVLIEYGDFQCPGCASMFPTIQVIKNQYRDKLTFIFREYPLTNIHPNAFAAATAAEAAGLQGKYYEMHDKLYQNQQAWANVAVNQRTGVFEGYASELGLDMDKFRTDLSSSAISEKINRDRSIGKKLNVNSTPSFVLNGELLSAEISTNHEELTKKIEDAIKAAFPDTKTSTDPVE